MSDLCQIYVRFMSDLCQIYVRFMSDLCLFVYLERIGTLYDAQHMVTKCRVNTEKCRPANAEFGKNARWVPRKTTCFVYNWWIPL